MQKLHIEKFFSSIFAIDGISPEIIEYWLEVAGMGAPFTDDEDEEDKTMDDIGVFIVGNWVDNSDVSSPTIQIDLEDLIVHELENSRVRLALAAIRAENNWKIAQKYYSRDMA